MSVTRPSWDPIRKLLDSLESSDPRGSPTFDPSNVINGFTGVLTNPYKWVFPEIGLPQSGWFIMEIPIKVDDLGVRLFLENTQVEPHSITGFFKASESHRGHSSSKFFLVRC